MKPTIKKSPETQIMQFLYRNASVFEFKGDVPNASEILIQQVEQNKYNFIFGAACGTIEFDKRVKPSSIFWAKTD